MTNPGCRSTAATKLQPSFQRAQVNEQAEGCVITIVNPGSGGHGLEGLSEGSQRRDSQAPGPVATLAHVSISIQPIYGGCAPTFIGLLHGSPPLHPPGSHCPKKLTQSLNSNRCSLAQKTLSSQFPYGFLLFALQDSVQVLHFARMSCLDDSIPPEHAHPLFSPEPRSSCRTHYYLCLNLNTLQGNSSISTSFTVLPIAWYWRWVLGITQKHTQHTVGAPYMFMK